GAVCDGERALIVIDATAFGREAIRDGAVADGQITIDIAIDPATVVGDVAARYRAVGDGQCAVVKNVPAVGCVTARGNRQVVNGEIGARVHRQNLDRTVAADGDSLPGAIDRQGVHDCGKTAAQRDRAADAEVNRVGTGARRAVAACCIGLGVGVVDRFAQGAEPVAGGGCRVGRVVD